MKKNSWLLKIILFISSVLFSGGSVLLKNYWEDNIFFCLQYQHPLLARHNGLNAIQMINKAWWGNPQDVTLNFLVRASSKNCIYVRYFGKKEVDGLFVDDEFSKDPNTLPTVSIFPSSRDVTISSIEDQGDGSFYVTVTGKLPPSSIVSVAVLWLNNRADKAIAPSLTTPGGDVCCSYELRPFTVKYHVFPVLFYSVACVLFGVWITLLFVKPDQTISGFGPDDIVKIDGINATLLDIKKEISEQKKKRKI